MNVHEHAMLIPLVRGFISKSVYNLPISHAGHLVISYWSSPVGGADSQRSPQLDGKIQQNNIK